VQVTYQCVYHSGPYEGPIDLCEFSIQTGGETCEAHFNELTGEYVFNCYDQVTFPPGVYIFYVVSSVGEVNYDVGFTLTLMDDCPDTASPVIINDPFSNGPYYYELKGQALRLPFNLE
jgi:hypothetical protein